MINKIQKKISLFAYDVQFFMNRDFLFVIVFGFVIVSVIVVIIVFVFISVVAFVIKVVFIFVIEFIFVPIFIFSFVSIVAGVRRGPGGSDGHHEGRAQHGLPSAGP